MNLFPRRRLAVALRVAVSFAAAVAFWLQSPGLLLWAQAAPPTITALSANEVVSGQTLTIYGSNFDWSVSAPDVNDSVDLGGVALPVETWSTSQITVDVPRDASSGALTVTADNGTSASVNVTVGPRGLLSVAQDGTVSTYGGATEEAGPAPSSSPAVSIAATPDGSGYWILHNDGTIASYGDATAFNVGAAFPGPAIGLAVTPSGLGGWVLAKNGTVASVGTVPSSVYGIAQSLPTGTYVGITPAPDGQGYYAVNSGGEVFGAGSVQGKWSTGLRRAVSIAADPAGGAWVLGKNGTVVGVDGAKSIGNVTAQVSLAGEVPAAIAPTPDGAGYYIGTTDGRIYPFGDAVLPASLPPLAEGRAPLAGLAVIGPYHAYGVEDLAYWYPTGSLKQYLTYQTAMGGAVNILSPHWFWVNGDGSIGGPESPTSIVPMIADMQAHGIQVAPMFGRTFNGTLGPLATASGQAGVVSGIMAKVNQFHLNGVNIDFEGLPSDSADYLTAFAQKMRAALGPNHILIINVYPDWAPYTNLSGQTVPGYQDTVYNYGALSQIANYVDVMAYSMAFNPGPIASLTHDRGIVDYLLHGASGTGSPIVDLNHILLGIPGYGQLWEGDTGYGTGPSLTIPQIEYALTKRHQVDAYDQRAGEDVAHFAIPFSAPGATLSQGETGVNVVALQFGLSRILATPLKFGASNRNGSLPALPLTLDGIYGSLTAKAVAAFQTDYDVQGDPSGVYGPATASKLRWVASHYASAFFPGIPATVWFDGGQADIAHVQLAQSSGLAGVALWAMGEADPNYFKDLSSSTNVVGNPSLDVSLSQTAMVSGVPTSLTVTVTQGGEGGGFPVANLKVSLFGQSATTNGAGQADLTVTPSGAGAATLTIQDPSGDPVATQTVTVTAPALSRIAGVDRYHTAVKLAQATFSRADTVILATSTNYPDALAGATLAHELGAPILLTNPNSLTSYTLEEMSRLGAQHVILLGGPAALSNGIETALTKEGYQVTRYFGATRFDTAAAIAGILPVQTTTAVIATGDNFPDALSIDPIAARQGWPLFLANGQDKTAPLDQPTLSALAKLGIQTAYIIGGQDSVPFSAETQLKKLHIKAVRIEGNGILGTNLAVLKYFAAQLHFSRIYVATAADFPDALTASPLAAATDSPVVLVPGKGPLPSPTSTYLAGLGGKVGSIDVAGGPAAVSTAEASQIAQITLK